MEIKEIVSYTVLPSANILEVTFRTIDDTDEHIRNVEIEYNEVANYGFELETESIDFFFDDDDDFEKEESESVELDDEELVTFLNEYFLLNPEKLPEATIF